MNPLNAALDTSWGFSLALEDEGGTPLAQEHLAAVGRESDRLLVPWLSECLGKVGATLAQVGRWTLGTGPGSFAGLRCGIAAVKGCALATGASLRGVPSAYAVALAVPASPGLVGVLHDGRCGEVLFSPFRRDEAGGLRPECPPIPLAPQRLEEEGRLCGAYGLLQPELLDLCPPSLREKATVLSRVPAEALLHAPEGLFPWEVDPTAQERSVEPLYVRQAVFVKPASLRADLS